MTGTEEEIRDSSVCASHEGVENVPAEVEDTADGLISVVKEEEEDLTEDIEEAERSLNTESGDPKREEHPVDDESEMVSCCAFGCNNNNREKTEGVSFHRFPGNPKLRKKWIYAVRRKNWSPNARSTVCSAHFREKWFDRTSLCVVRLREGAVPDIFPAIESILSRAMKRKAEGNSTVERPSRRKSLDRKHATSSTSDNDSSSVVSNKENGGSRETVLHNSKLPDGSSCELALARELTPKTYKAKTFITSKTPSVKLKTQASPQIERQDKNKKTTARKSTTMRQTKMRRRKRAESDSDTDSAPECSSTTKKPVSRPKPRPSAKATQTTVTLQQACNEMIRMQQEILTLRQQLELAREDNKRLQTRLNLMGPLTCPGDIVVQPKTRTLVKGNQQWQKSGAEGPKKPADPNDIWDPNEVQIVPTGDDVIKDPRHQPTVNIVYKQKVGSEDMFLQVGRKTPMTSSCESMIVTLTMKGETMKDIDCNITEKFLDIRSPLYRYHLPFPNTVDPDTAEAEWNTPASQLIITVNLVRELDAVNF